MINIQKDSEVLKYYKDSTGDKQLQIDVTERISSFWSLELASQRSGHGPKPIRVQGTSGQCS